MNRKAMVMQEDKEKQLDRFKEAARELGADESPDALDRIIGKLDLNKKSGKLEKEVPDQPEERSVDGSPNRRSDQ